MTSPSETNPEVYFEGTWPESELELIEAAAQEVEREGYFSSGPDLKAPWVAIYYPMGREAMYVASRFGSSRVLRARSAETLAEKIRQHGAKTGLE